MTLATALPETSSTTPTATHQIVLGAWPEFMNLLTSAILNQHGGDGHCWVRHIGREAGVRVSTHVSRDGAKVIASLDSGGITAIRGWAIEPAVAS